jgi:ornithine cyclodeaminase
MRDGDILIVKGNEVRSVLTGQEQELLRVVRSAYVAHALGKSSLPHSTFLTFPEGPQNRIIALPAYLGDGFDIAGVKWISSFPGNLDLGFERASAVLILNSMETGRPQAIIESSIISAKRTAVSAALAAQCLLKGKSVERVGMVGGGVINFEIVRFLQAACPDCKSFVLFDLDEKRGQHFKEQCLQTFEHIEVDLAGNVQTVLSAAPLISIATTASKPHLFDLSKCAPGTTILHISLRDLSPEIILSCDNVVDDINHVCRAQTSVHLAEQLAGHRDFIRCTLADILMGAAPEKSDEQSITIFSPFGLGILDIAVGKLVLDLEVRQNRGMVVKSFLPTAWSDKIAKP